MTDTSEVLRKVFSDNNALSDINLQSDIEDKLIRLIEIITETNKQLNLTAITEPSDIILKHIADSATVIKHIPKNAKLLDVGTGGGFPALPVAILRPDVSVTAMDSTAKKLKHIDNAAKELELSNIVTLTGRAEELAHNEKYRGKFDVVTARAVAELNILCELCITFVKVGGRFIAMKGSRAPEEIQAAVSAAVQLGGSRFSDTELSLSCGDIQLQRHIIISQKNKPSPENFPRPYNRISKKPL